MEEKDYKMKMKGLFKKLSKKIEKDEPVAFVVMSAYPNEEDEKKTVAHCVVKADGHQIEKMYAELAKSNPEVAILIAKAITSNLSKGHLFELMLTL